MWDWCHGIASKGLKILSDARWSCTVTVQSP